MRIAMMNDPRRDPLEEVRWAVRHGFEAFDLTLEPPKADPRKVPAAKIAKVAEKAGLEVVGHTAWFLPFGSPFRRLRDAAVEEFVSQLPVFAEAGARLVNAHAWLGHGLVHKGRCRAWCAESLARLADAAEPLGLTVMVENMPGESAPKDVEVLLGDPRLALHLDVAHAAIGEDQTPSLLERFGDRVRHVHLSDNNTQRDEHLPLGAGRMHWGKAVKALKRRGYDATITLEVFSQDRRLLIYSRDRLRKVWDSA